MTELFRPLDESTLADPHPMYHQLRAADPVHWFDPLKAWVVSGYDDCWFALHHAEVFSSDWRRAGVAIPDNLQSIQTLDPPGHGEVHRIVMDAYRQQDFDSIRSRLELCADEKLGDLAGRKSFDLVADFSAPFAFAAVAELLGMASADEEKIVSCSEAIVAAMDSGLTPEAAGPGTAARDRLSAMISGCLDNPPDAGLLADVLRQQRDADVSRDMILNTLRAVLHAGYAPSSRLIASATLALLRSPGTWERLLGDEVTDTAVRELGRHSGPVQAVARVCSEDTELGGRQLRRGSDVILLIAAANRDPARFARPDDLDLDRDPAHNLSFGWGVHACVGASLARLACTIALSALLRHAPRLRLAGEPEHWRHATLRGLRTLPVTAARATA